MDGADSAADLFARVLRGAEHDAPSVSSGDSTAAAVGGFLVCLDVPAATEFGVDYEVFRTGPKFQGVKFLPLGIHFVLFRSREQEHGIRQGFFVHVERHAQVIVREWSMEKEELGLPRPGLNLENLERMATDPIKKLPTLSRAHAVVGAVQVPCCPSSWIAGWGHTRSST
ncbi:unnamed protein product [Phytophthora fragariaefolia]|uniref:Unnamed protein product n=1 Tax=Phytophthora fragariaefolia TaxID=1490495 RepID=A0A9W6TL77_9STRA|nr:unnamed protein product [Phytophthora fragariaefolia]